MERDIRNALWNLSDVYRGLLFTERLTSAVVRIIFVKFVTDNYSYADTKDEMRYYANVQKAISNRDVKAFTDAVIPVLEMIDGKVHANGILIRSYSALLDDLLSVANKKKNYSIDQSKMVLDVISSIDLDTTNINKELLLSSLQEYIYSSVANSGKYGAELATTETVNRLAASLLKVDSLDTYMDFACGYGLSAMEITQGNPIEMFLSDVNEEVVQLAFMLNIIAENNLDMIHISVKDAFEPVSPDTAVSKVFVDFPLNMRIDRSRYMYREGTVLAIRRMIDCLKENGTGVITCHSAILFTRSKEGSDLREDLLSNGYLQAVITLPSVVPYSTININLLILSKKHNDRVVFVDASKNDFIRFSKNAKALNTQLTAEGIERITDIISGVKEIPGVSAVVQNERIFKEQTLVPGAYIEVPLSKNYMSSYEIREKLKDLYKQLNDLN